MDASLLFYQKSIESLYENGLGLIEHHKVACKVKTTTGDYIAGNRKVYLSLVIFCTEHQKLSNRDCTELMDVIKWITREQGEEIPLPSR